MTYTTEQISLCKQLYEKMPKREPKVGETWVLLTPREQVLVIKEKLDPLDLFQVFHFNNRNNYLLPSESFLHPLFSEGELLELLRILGLGFIYYSLDEECPENCAWIAVTKDWKYSVEMSLLTALLKLAIEVMEGK